MIKISSNGKSGFITLVFHDSRVKVTTKSILISDRDNKNREVIKNRSRDQFILSYFVD